MYFLNVCQRTPQTQDKNYAFHLNLFHLRMAKVGKKSCIRRKLVMLYCAECWAAQTKHNQSLHAAEIRMLDDRPVSHVSITSKTHIQGSMKLSPRVETMLERRSKWYGHVLRRELYCEDSNVHPSTVKIKRKTPSNLSWYHTDGRQR